VWLGLGLLRLGIGFSQECGYSSGLQLAGSIALNVAGLDSIAQPLFIVEKKHASETIYISLGLPNQFAYTRWVAKKVRHYQIM